MLTEMCRRQKLPAVATIWMLVMSLAENYLHAHQILTQTIQGEFITRPLPPYPRNSPPAQPARNDKYEAAGTPWSVLTAMPAQRQDVCLLFVLLIRRVCVGIFNRTEDGTSRQHALLLKWPSLAHKPCYSISFRRNLPSSP